MEKRVMTFKDMNELEDKMDGTRIALGLDGSRHEEWIEGAYIVSTKDGLKAVFINSWFLEWQA